MADDAAQSPHSRLSIDKLIADAAEQGLPPPTVETLIRSLSCPRVPLKGSGSLGDMMVTGEVSDDRALFDTTCLVHLPSLGPLLSRVGLDYMLAKLTLPRETRLRDLHEGMRRHLDWHLKDLHDTNHEIIPDTLARFVEDARWLWLELRAPEVDGRRSSFQTSHDDFAACSAWHHGQARSKSTLVTTPEGYACDQAISELERFRTAVVPLSHLSRLQAGDAGSVLMELLDASPKPLQTVHLLLGETDLMPLFLLPTTAPDAALYNLLGGCPTPRSPHAHTTLSHLGLSLDGFNKAVKLCPPQPNAPTQPSLPSRPSALLLFGDRVPYHASMVSHGTSLIHLAFSLKTSALIAKAEQQIRGDLLKQLRKLKYSPARRYKSVKQTSSMPSAGSTASKEYRLVTFAELQENEPIDVAFVTTDQQLVTLHRLQPYSMPSPATDPSSSLPTPPESPLLGRQAKITKLAAPKKVLLVSSRRRDSGWQGDVFRAYCANSPFSLVVHYTRFHERRYTWQKPHKLTDEIDFYRKYGDRLAEEKIAPRFVSGWTTGPTDSPHMFGSPSAVMILEDCGQVLDIKRKFAVYDLARRLHGKFGLEHGDLSPLNFLWYPSLGYSSLRLINWTSFRVHEGKCTRSAKTAKERMANEEERRLRETKRVERGDSDEESEEEEHGCSELDRLWRKLGLADGVSAEKKEK
ncbi:hypothetical protein NBRC10512_001456 [Rhodotorula toruloides]|uniref:Uncharacterized protein n=1 Tax=Rhodotorula toruloides (strain NP11) TaxID=1130832 RepID=M7WJZ9_RHOT1|nr:uncharacterized protein RHTO_06419 [Rhodotorula toruloides NP11]EMS18376.1 hypothetical protein RHTO_06419 [Rhodotorula toruloides NP11]